MKRSAGTALVVALLAVTIATATDAKAEERSSGASSAAFSSLPTGNVPLPPKAKAPARISANEKVAGFFIAGRKGHGADYITLLSSATMAKQFNDGTRDEHFLAGAACFAEDEQAFRRNDEAERAWSSSLQPILTMNASAQGGQRPVVTAVHSERIAEEAGRASLEVVDAWVDPNTRGVRLIGRSSVPLQLVSTLLGGTKIYAARESQSIHVILVTPHAHAFGQTGLFATVDNAVANSSCDHIRATLKTEKGQGETASFVSNVELPSLEPKDSPEGKPDALNAIGSRPSRTEARVRPVHVHASVTWPSREKEPLLSVSAGWDSRERTAIVF